MQPQCRGTKFRVLRAEEEDWVCMLGKESAVCTDQPHICKELHNINQGGPVWSFCFLEKLEEAQEEISSFVHLLIYIKKKKIAKLLHCTAGGIFALSLQGLMWKKNLLLILQVEVWGICNCSIGKHLQFLEMGKETIPQQLSDLQSNSLKATLKPALFLLWNILFLSSKV